MYANMGHSIQNRWLQSYRIVHVPRDCYLDDFCIISEMDNNFVHGSKFIFM